VRQSRLRYVEDELAFGQLAGEHKLDFLLVDWRTVLARTTRDEPDTRHISYIRPAADPTAPLRFDDQQLGGTRIANETREDLTDSALDFTIPFETGLPRTDVWSGLPGKFKLGPAYSFRDRTFRQRRIEFVPDPSGVDTTQPPDDVLAPDNVGPGGVDITETSLPTDHFKGTQEIIAGYGMLELPLVRDRLRIVGGARVEYSLIRVMTQVFSQELCGDEAICQQNFRQKSLDVLPGVNLVYNPMKDMNVRLAWSQSVSRPELRELAPADFPAQRGERATVGNPDLRQFDITSYDARWEWFFSPLEVVSAGFFYKQLDRPIERFTLLRGTDPVDTFANSESATILGVEFEVRKDFGFIRPKLKNLSATLNFTWTESDAEVGRPLVFGTRSFPTSAERQVIGQAPFIVNAAIEYADPDLVTARLAYLTVDAAIDSAGTQGVPDTIEERRDLLDFVLLVPLKRWLDVPLSVKLSAENLLNDQRIYTVGDTVQRRWIDGVTFGLGISYSQ
jgi:TonB-dependent receptor